MKQTPSASDLHLKLAQQIIDFINEESLPIDTHLRENELAEKFRVSRSPIRSTLKYLSKLNIVEHRENHGFFLKQDGKKCMTLPLGLPQSKVDKLCEEIAKDWFEQTIPKEVSETEIRKRYNLGRITASRILQKLSDEGVVLRSPGYGWVFQPTLNTPDAHDESYDLRLIIEPASILLPSFKLNNSVAELLLNRHEAVLVNKSPKLKLPDLFKLDVDFHNFVADCSNNRFVSDTIDRQNKLRRLVEYVSLIDTGRLEASCLEHIAILNSLRARKLKQASKLMKEHLKKAKSIGPSFLMKSQ